MQAEKQEITPAVHLVKKVFGGEITGFIRKAKGNEQQELFD
jgi:hypothetical protein